MAANTPENKVKRRLVQQIKTLDLLYFNHGAGEFTRPGWPDYAIIHNGMYFGVECKGERPWKLTPLQRQVHKQIEAAGGYVMIIDSEYTSEAIRIVLRTTLNIR